MTKQLISTLPPAGSSKVAIIVSMVGMTAANAAIVGEFNDGVLNWAKSGSISTFTESGGSLNGTVVGGDPWVSRTSVGSVETAANPYLHIRLKKDAALNTTTNFFWDDGTSFTGTQRADFSSVSDGNYYDYVVDLSSISTWNSLNEVTSFRLDPASSAGGNFELDYMRLSSSATDSHALVVDDFSGTSHNWTLANIAGASEAGGLFSATSSSGDPFMFRNILDLDGTSANLVTITMTSGAASIGQIFWGNEDGGFAAQRSQNFSVLAGTNTYQIDLSLDPDWNGKTITDFRIDPVNGSGIAFSIDSIDIAGIAAVPEPSSTALLGLGGLALMLRRRR